MSYRTNPNYMTTSEAAAHCGLATMTLHNYRHHGKGPVFVKEGRFIYYERSALEVWNGARRPRKTRAR